MVIPIEVEAKHYYRTYIACLNPILKLKKAEMELLEVLIKTYFTIDSWIKKGQIAKDGHYKTMYTPVAKEIMRKTIGQSGISEASFNNRFSVLKKMKVLNELGELPSYLTSLDFKEARLDFRITIKELPVLNNDLKRS